MESFFGDTDFFGEADFLGEREFFGDFFFPGDSDITVSAFFGESAFLGDTAFLGEVYFLGERDVFRSRRFFGDRDSIIFEKTLRRSSPSSVLKDARPLGGGEPALSIGLWVPAALSALLLRNFELSPSVRAEFHSL